MERQRPVRRLGRWQADRRHADRHRLACGGTNTDFQRAGNIRRRQPHRGRQLPQRRLWRLARHRSQPLRDGRHDRQQRGFRRNDQRGVSGPQHFTFLAPGSSGSGPDLDRLTLLPSISRLRCNQAYRLSRAPSSDPSQSIFLDWRTVRHACTWGQRLGAGKSWFQWSFFRRRYDRPCGHDEYNVLPHRFRTGDRRLVGKSVVATPTEIDLATRGAHQGASSGRYHA